MRNLFMNNLFIKFLFFLFFSFQILYASSKPFNVTFVSSLNNDNYFGYMSHSFAQASANDLNIQLEIKIPKKSLDRFEYLESLKEVFKRKNKPDFVIAKFYEKISIDILSMSEQYDIPIFIINSNISKNNIKNIGRLRRKFGSFMGHIAPDEEQVGYDLAKFLIKLKRETNPDGRLKVAAMFTSKIQTKSKKILKGLEKAVKEEYLTKLYHPVYTPSKKQEAYIQTSRLLKKYYDLNVILAETDVMALGANEAIIDNDLSSQVISGGVGFTKESIDSVKNNGLKALVGGSFMDAGLAMILINDYLHGIDFIDEFDSKINSNTFLITSKNINEYLKIFNATNLKKIDFKKYSKVYNKNQEKYNFSIENFLNN